MCRIVANIVGLAIFVIFFSTLSLGFGSEEKPLREVKVCASGEIKVVPDEVVISLAVVTENKDLLAAKSENDEKTCKILELAEKYRLEKNSFQIDQMSIYPKYSTQKYKQQTESSSEDEEKLLGYSVSRSMSITIKDFGVMEQIISDALSLGANRMTDLNFRTTEIRKYQFETRKKTVEFAKEKAGHLAELNGLKLGKAISIEEGLEGNNNTTEFASMAFEAMTLPTIPKSTFSAEHKQLPHVIQASFTDDQPQKANSDKIMTISNKKVDEKPASTKKQPIAPGYIVISSTITVTFELIVP